MGHCAGCDAWHDGECVHMADVYGRRISECSSGDYPPACIYSRTYGGIE